MSFQEVSGLADDAEIIEHHAGNSPTQFAFRMPGLAQLGTVTMNRGLAPIDSALWDLLNQNLMQPIQTSTVTIRLLDADGKTAMAWTLAQAVASKLRVFSQQSGSNEVLIETLEVVHSGMRRAGA